MLAHGSACDSPGVPAHGSAGGGAGLLFDESQPPSIIITSANRQPRTTRPYHAVIREPLVGDRTAHREQLAVRDHDVGEVVAEDAHACRGAQILVARDPQRLVPKAIRIITAGDLARSLASWTLDGTGPDGPIQMTGTTSDVFRRQPDGSWKVAIDNPWESRRSRCRRRRCDCRGVASVRTATPLESTMSRTRTLTISLLALATGCAMMMKGAGPTERTADNPLVSGSPLEVTSNARIGTASEQDCTIWPFEDRLSVAITEAEICISVRKHVEQSPGWTGEPTANRSEGFTVANDANEGGSIQATKVKASKVGSCYERGYKANIGVWAFEYAGCAPNNGTVTQATKSLRVGREQWTFAAAAAPAAAANTP